MSDGDWLDTGKRAQPVPKPLFLAEGGAQLLPFFLGSQPDLRTIICSPRKSVEPSRPDGCMKSRHGGGIRGQIREDNVATPGATELTEDSIHELIAKLG
jgi:hypothetical protein